MQLLDIGHCSTTDSFTYIHCMDWNWNWNLGLETAPELESLVHCYVVNSQNYFPTWQTTYYKITKKSPANIHLIEFNSSLLLAFISHEQWICIFNKYECTMDQELADTTAYRWADAVCALITWQHFYALNGDMAVIILIWNWLDMEALHPIHISGDHPSGYFFQVIETWTMKSAISWHALVLNETHNLQSQKTLHILWIKKNNNRKRQFLQRSTSKVWEHIAIAVLNIQATSSFSCQYATGLTTGAPRIWNSWPLTVRTAPSVNTFRRHLKTHLFTSNTATD